MPRATRKICCWSACVKVIDGGSRYCEKHAKEHKKREDKLRKPSEHSWVYKTTTWQSIRLQVKREEPICVKCGIRATREIDHIKPISDGGEPFDRSNLQGLCKPCHSSKTAREDGRWGKSKKVG